MIERLYLAGSLLALKNSGKNMKQFPIHCLVAVMSLNSCGASMASVANNGKGFNTSDEVACVGLDTWAVSAMLRSPVPWIQAAGYTYGGLALIFFGVHWMKKFDSKEPEKNTSEKDENHPRQEH